MACSNVAYFSFQWISDTSFLKVIFTVYDLIHIDLCCHFKTNIAAIDNTVDTGLEYAVFN